MKAGLKMLIIVRDGVYFFPVAKICGRLLTIVALISEKLKANFNKIDYLLHFLSINCVLPSRIHTYDRGVN